VEEFVAEAHRHPVFELTAARTCLSVGSRRATAAAT
jgi:hypothetical protein